jgi:arginyl-tRNA synthetase
MPGMAGADLSAVGLGVPKIRGFGDFATNAALVLAKRLGQSPRDIAARILPEISALPFVSGASVAGPGFVNMRLCDEFIADAAFAPAESGPGARGGAMVIDLDYGSYNVAKALHIGHLRGSIIGDTFYRIARYLGHRPVSYNHMGDWGKPMALVIAWIIRLFPNDWNRPDFMIDEEGFNDYYPAAARYAKENPEFLEQVLRIKAEFQDGGNAYYRLYEKFLKISLAHMDYVVKKLNMLPFDNNLGERNAAKYLKPVEEILRGKNLLSESDGATVIELKRDTDSAPMPPFMFFDSRGADTYDSTDLAAIYYRKITDNPDKIIYFTDYRQQLHFQQLFRAAEISGIFPARDLEFPYFGAINGADGKPFKTRDGAVATLVGMIGVVEDAVCARVAESGKNLPPETIEMIALAALKFNDLMHESRADYVFDPDAVTQFEGRTGPYILYTAVRLNSILRKQAAEPRATAHADSDAGDFHPSERELLLAALDFDRCVSRAFDSRDTSVLANYAYDLCQLVNAFYHNCPILRADVGDALRARRLRVVRVSADVLFRVVDLMGLKVPPEM